ncbi:heparin lyase I family protein [Planctomycetota bacterium]
MKDLVIKLVLGLSLLVSPGFAELLWYGDPARGRAVFNNLNFEGTQRYGKGSGTILPAVDPVHGPIWRVYKPAPDRRAEIRGATGFSHHVGKGGVVKEGETYYLGWRYKFNMPEKKMKGWACFQWKSYPEPNQPDSRTQEYPVLMGYNGREMTVTKYGSGWKKHRDRIVPIWSKPVSIGIWVDVVLVIKLSRDKEVGYLEFYFNGEKQTLLTGGTRVYHNTMDGWEVAPKWGAYNRHVIGTEITVDLADLRIGTDLKAVMPTLVTGQFKR